MLFDVLDKTLLLVKFDESWVMVAFTVLGVVAMVSSPIDEIGSLNPMDKAVNV